MWFQNKLDAFKARFESGAAPHFLPREAAATMQRSVDELTARGLPERALKAGDLAPAFTLADTNGFQLSSASLLERGPLVVMFYRGVWCPYCSLELQALQDLLPQVQQRGATLVAISPQMAGSSLKAKDQNHLTFPVLLDPGNRTADAFGIRWRQQDYLIDLYKTVFETDLAEVNGDDSWTLPMPSRFVIGRDNRLRHAAVSIDHTRRPDPEELLAALEG
ncbi:MAG: peroxiredoxin-like family protein [Caulobacteraceae bacterium]